MPHLQPYGIHLAADLAGLITIAGIGAVLWPNRRVFWTTMLLLNTVSALGSLSLLPTAFSRGDVTVAAYHLLFVLVLLPLGRACVNAWSATPKAATRSWAPSRRPARPATGPDDVYVITTLPPAP